MTYVQPTNADEYINNTKLNTKMEGLGIETRSICPCPFCAAPGWLSFSLVDTREAMQQGSACKECGRSAKFVFTEHPGTTGFELVQTGGDDPPSWLTPKIRRVELNPTSDVGVGEFKAS